MDLANIIITGPYTKTLDGEEFSLYDFGQNYEKRVLLFLTFRKIDFLHNSDTVFGNGTFKTFPNQFMQLF